MKSVKDVNCFVTSNTESSLVSFDKVSIRRKIGIQVFEFFVAGFFDHEFTAVSFEESHKVRHVRKKARHR